jgi:TRAP-type C4-dicarboxylate transport system substrate-binding protein
VAPKDAGKNGAGRKVVKFDRAIIAAGSQSIKLPFIPDDPRNLYTALTPGLVDVQDNSLSIFRLIRLQEVHRFILLSGLSDTGEIYLLDFAAVLSVLDRAAVEHATLH